MPTATDELRAAWPGGDDDACSFLRRQGYTLTRKWTWKHRDEGHKPTARETSAVNYLFQEWDFGGFE